MVLQGMFDVPMPPHFSDTLSHRDKETGDIMKAAYAKFKERLLKYHDTGGLQRALKNENILQTV